MSWFRQQSKIHCPIVIDTQYLGFVKTVITNYFMPNVSMIAECDVPVPGIPGTGNFLFFGGIGTSIGKKLVS